MSKKYRAQQERCDASEAILAMTEQPDGTILLTMAAGWENVLPKHGEDDPGVLVVWDNDNLVATVHNFNAAVAAGHVAPPWFGRTPFTVPGLKLALLTHMQTRGGGGGLVGNALIAPNGVERYKNVCSEATNLGTLPLLRNNAQPAASFPIGRFYILKDQLTNNTATRDEISHPLPGLGVPLFE